MSVSWFYRLIETGFGAAEIASKTIIPRECRFALPSLERSATDSADAAR
jgi:hypothetical protein